MGAYTQPIAIGEPRQCLVTSWGCVREAVAQQFQRGLETYWSITLMQARGKGGKDVYPVVGIKKHEDEDFVLI
jgi:hypothetical protein